MTNKTYRYFRLCSDQGMTLTILGTLNQPDVRNTRLGTSPYLNNHTHLVQHIGLTSLPCSHLENPEISSLATVAHLKLWTPENAGGWDDLSRHIFPQSTFISHRNRLPVSTVRTAMTRCVPIREHDCQASEVPDYQPS